jgi:kynurenine formamidase
MRTPKIKGVVFMRKQLLFALLASLLLTACAKSKTEFPKGKIVDLSHAFDAQTIYWPTEQQGFVLEKEQAGVTDKGYYYASNKFGAPEHGGTHIDAPRHFSANGNTLDQVPLDQLMGSAILIDVTKQCEANRDYLISVDDFNGWEKQHGQIPGGAIVLLRTGFAKYWPDRTKYMGTDERGAAAVAKLHFPGLSPEAARWLTTNRSIKAIGLDTPSIDYGQSTMYESHQVLFAKNIPAFENLGDLSSLPAEGFFVIAMPMKIAGGSGGPLRVAAIVE